MKILICGGRDFTDQEYVNRALRRLAQVYGRFDIIEGGQRTKDSDTGKIIGGADYWAYAWGKANDFTVRTYPADWKTHGNYAGPIRNKQMLDVEAPDLVAAFKGGAGTKNMLRQAAKRDIRCLLI